MQVKLNSEVVDTPDGLKTVGEVVGYIERDLLPSQHVITKILKDGHEVTGRAGEDLAFSQAAGDCALEIFSARAVDVAKEGLADAAQLMPAIADELPTASAELAEGDVEVGLVRFSHCMESISWYVGLLGAVEYILSENGIGALGTAAQDGEELSPEYGTLSGWPGQDDGLLSFASVENLRQKLLDVQLAQMRNDTDLLSNIIQYEILPIVEIWIRELPTLASRVSRLGNVA